MQEAESGADDVTGVDTVAVTATKTQVLWVSLVGQGRCRPEVRGRG